MNPHEQHSGSLWAMWLSIHHNWSLIWQMTKREVIGRYRGSVMGVAWSFFQPLLMLVVYTFVFSVVFQAKWGGNLENGKVSFAIILFSGLIIHGLFAECVNRSPSLILSNVNYVKRVVFPLEILPVIALGTSLFHFMVSFLILLGAMMVAGLSFHFTALYLPLLLFPLVMATLGASWFMAAMGVYLRDLGHMVGVLTMIMLFLSPVFFPISAVPEQLRGLIYLNPLTFIIEQVRMVLIWGSSPDWLWLGLYCGISLCIAWFGFWSFQRTRKGFSDVV